YPALVSLALSFGALCVGHYRGISTLGPTGAKGLVTRVPRRSRGIELEPSVHAGLSLAGCAFFTARHGNRSVFAQGLCLVGSQHGLALRRGNPLDNTGRPRQAASVWPRGAHAVSGPSGAKYGGL